MRDTNYMGNLGLKVIKKSMFWFAALAVTLTLVFTGPIQAGVVVIGGGLELVEEGGIIEAGNLSAGVIAFAFDVISEGGLPSYQIDHLNDQIFGNDNSWIGNSADSFAGITLGGSPMQVQSIAFGRDSQGVQPDRLLGLYTIQYTDVLLPDESTPDEDWTTIGTIEYTAPQDYCFYAGYLRHRYNFDPVMATGIRIITAALGTCIDELELYATAGDYNCIEPPVSFAPEACFSISWNGNDGDYYGEPVPDNLALATNGTGAIGSSEFPHDFHSITHINDGLYGNLNSWLADIILPDPDPWIAVVFPSEVDIGRIAWGRDNLIGYSDRAQGIYTILYTQVESPSESTAVTGDPTTGWSSMGTISINYDEDAVVGGGFTCILRHEYEVSFNGSPIAATALRINPSSNGLIIDELEVYAPCCETSIPSPEDGSWGYMYDEDVTLSWTRGHVICETENGALNAHHLYFDPNLNLLNTRGDLGTLPVETTEKLITAAELEPGKTYYWRVDEEYTAATVTGNVWSFDIPPLPSFTTAAFYEMEGADPSVLVDSIGNNNMTLWNTSEDPNVSTDVADLVGGGTTGNQSREFFGGEEGFTVAANLVDNDNFVIEAYVKPTYSAFPTPGVLAVSGNGYLNGQGLVVGLGEVQNNYGYLICQLAWIDSAYPLNAYNWVHLALVRGRFYNDHQVTLLINHEEVSSSAIAPNPVNPADPQSHVGGIIAPDNSWVNPFLGKIDNVRFSTFEGVFDANDLLPTVEPFSITIQVEPDNIGIDTVLPFIGTQEPQNTYEFDISASSFVNCPDVWRFSHWQGDVADPNSPSTSLVIDMDKTITAVFYLDERKCGDECHPILKGDLNFDCHINLEDFLLYMDNWLVCTAPECD